MDLRKTRVISKLSRDQIESVVDTFLSSVDPNDLADDISNQTRDKISEVYDYEVEETQIDNISVNLDGGVYKYSIDVIGTVQFRCATYYSSHISYGDVHGIVKVNCEVIRHATENEKEFINRFNDNDLDLLQVIDIKSAVLEGLSYFWSSDEDIDEDEEPENDYAVGGDYPQCGYCGKEMNAINDAGNGYCISCTEEKNL